MSQMTRQRLQLDERRAQLLDIGLELFTELAYEDVSIDDIASAAGVSKGLLYHYFGSKKAFYVACVRVSADRMVESVRPDPDLPLSLKALTGLISYLDFVEARSTVFRQLLLGAGGSVDSEVAMIVSDTRRRLSEQILEGTGIDPARPIFRFAARTYVGAVEAASLAWLENPESIDRRVVVRSMLGALHALMSAAAELDPDAGVVVPDPAEALTGLALLDS